MRILLLHHEQKAKTVHRLLNEKWPGTRLLFDEQWEDLCKLAENDLSRAEADVLILDINFPQAAFGGIELFSCLQQSHGERWEHTIFLTKYADMRAAGPNELAALSRHAMTDSQRTYSFADQNGIPRANVIGPLTREYDDLLMRLCEIDSFLTSPRESSALAEEKS